MRAEIRQIHFDLNDRERVAIKSEHDFRVEVDLIVGPQGQLGGNDYIIYVCSPAWLASQPKPILGRFLLIVESFNEEEIEAILKALVAEYSAETWPELGQKLARFMEWEFEDYEEMNPESLNRK